MNEDREYSGLRSSWNSTRMLLRGPLTDKKIEEYRRRGWYSAEFKEARRKLAANKKAKRDGNFILSGEGRLIFSPL